MSLKKVVACVKRHKRFLITAHTGLEGDALGSELALCRLLHKLGKQASVVNEDALPAEYAFLPGASAIRRYADLSASPTYDCFVAVDCSDLRRSGKVERLYEAKKPLLNIDHHVSNSRFGSVNWVEPSASSASEMIYRLYRALGLALDKDVSLLLYVGIFTDTGSFRYPNTTSATHSIISRLLRYGIDPAAVYKHTYENIPYRFVRSLGSVLAATRRSAGGRVIWLYLDKSPLADGDSSFDWPDYLLGVMRAVKGVEVALLFRRIQKGKIRVNLRSQGAVDVNRVAAAFGGGGHKTASGCTVRDSAKKVIRQVLFRIRQEFLR